jgi:hypothetical protein
MRRHNTLSYAVYTLLLDVMDGFLSPPSSAGSIPRPSKPARRVGTTRERLGCLTCRHRRKKCDELYPICGHCKRLNLVCKREEPRQVVPAKEEVGSTAVARRQSASKLPKVIDIWSLDPEKSQDRRAMLSYYSSVLAVLLTTNHDNNSFLSGESDATCVEDNQLRRQSSCQWQSNRNHSKYLS